MKKSGTNRSSRQTSQGRSSSARAGSKRSSQTPSSEYGSSRRGSSDRMRDEDERYTSDDGGYYSNRNLSGRSGQDRDVRWGSQGNFNDRQGFSGRGSGNWDDYGDSSRSSYRDWDHDEDAATGRRYEGSTRREQSQRNAPYRSSEANYDSESNWNRDQYGQSDWNRPERSGRSSSRWDRSERDWSGDMSGRDQEMGYGASGIDGDEYGYDFNDRNLDREGTRGERFSRYSDIDDVEGQYDEDYRDRDSHNYSRTGRGSGMRSSSGQRR